MPRYITKVIEELYYEREKHDYNKHLEYNIVVLFKYEITFNLWKNGKSGCLLPP